MDVAEVHQVTTGQLEVTRADGEIFLADNYVEALGKLDGPYQHLVGMAICGCRLCGGPK